MNYKFLQKLSIILLSISLLLALTLTFSTRFITKFDYTITQHFYNSFPTFSNFVKNYTAIGNVKSIIIITSLITILLIFTKNYWQALFISTNVTFIAVFNHLIKYIFTRQRPSVVHLVNESGYSFPSGHSATSMALFLSLAILINFYFKNKPIKVILSIITIAFPILIAASRIYVGVHFFTDVTTGLCYSASFVLFMTIIYKNKLIFKKNTSK